MERKLAAILSADVVGYSRLMGADEDATLEALRSHRGVVDALIEAHRGRVFNSAGDSAVAEFPSAVEASLCAVEIQQEIARRNELVPLDRRLQFRIGINIGDVVADGGNLFGDGVNIADRVQKLAEPGGVCVSRNVHDQLTSKVGFKLEPMGEHRVKNIAFPISVYKVVVVGDAARSRPIKKKLFGLLRQFGRAAVIGAVLLAAVASLALWQWQRIEPRRAGFPSVAVLPFQNFSGDAALDSYSDGVAEDLTTAMSRFPVVTVVSRSSSFANAGTDVETADTSGQMKVDYVIEGSVQKTGNGLRLNAQLIDAQTDSHVWAEGYDGNDSSALQDDAIGRIANALASDGGAIRGHEYKQTAGTAKTDFSEYDYFLSGHEIFARFTSIEEHDRAGAIWREGLEKFPNSALLRVSLAWFHFFRPWDFNTEKPTSDYRRAGELAREALSGRNVSPGVQWSGRKLMAYIHWFEGNFERAVGDAEAAVALAPYDADTLSFLSRVQAASGNTTRALELVQESMRRNPSIQRNTRILAWIYYLTGEYEKSIEAAKKHQELSRQFGGDASSYMVASYVRLGRMEDARAALQRWLAADPQWTQVKERNSHLERPYKDRAVFERQLADLAAAGLPELPFGYDGKSQDRLSAEEIKALTFGHTLRAKDIRSGAAYTDVIAIDGTIHTSGDLGQDTGTLLHLGNSLVCYQWKEWGPGCAAIFRGGRNGSQPADAFTWVDAWGEYRYSIEK
jgi:adenylate cyclase